MIRVLDPATAVLRPGQEVGTTVYVADRLLVRGDQLWQRDPRVDEVLRTLGWELRVPQRYADSVIPRRRPRNPGVDLASTQVAGLELRIAADVPTPAPDAWTALQQIRSVVEPAVAAEYALVHVMVAASWAGVGKGGTHIPGIGKGGTHIPGIGKGGTHIPGIGLGPNEFGVPGYGGKAPVAVVAADPSRNAPRLKRPPVVVMPDTGIGEHPWFPDEAVVGLQPAPGTSLGVRVRGNPVPDREPGIASRLTGTTEPLSGHGTFIAGIVRQACPSARLTAIPVMSSEGLVAEDDALDVLQDLLDGQLAALAAGDAAGVVDVLTLSFGYYHEDLPGEDADPAGLPATSLGTILSDLGRAGVLVVAGAGNDGTSRPFLPAALAAPGSATQDALPLVSVGSLNPDTRTVSLFSNGGSWVTTYRRGAAIVSTLPRGQNAGVHSSSDVSGPDSLSAAEEVAVAAGTAPPPADRATIDMDDFSGGFGTWSGTSFAAPLLAGELARALVEQGTDDATLPALLGRARKALRTVLRPRRPR